VKKQEQEIAALDQETLERLAADIVKNKRLAWLIVDKWLTIHNYVLTDADQAEREFKTLINQIDNKQRSALHKKMIKKQSI
jgi:hypothetical protein